MSKNEVHADVPFATVNLLCDYAKQPLGVGSATPLLSWSMRHRERGQGQSAYRILVASSLAGLGEDRGDLWDTGRVDSDLSAGIRYAGRELTSGQSCYWKVKTWDYADREGTYSEPAMFELGLLRETDWQGSWVGHAGGFSGASMLMRHEFELEQPAAEIARARVYVAGLGYYELRMNGAKVGDHVLAPAVTDYDKRVLYGTYDAGPLLQDGRNVVGLILGNGWYGTPKARVQMNIDYADGTRQEISTKWNWGEGWQVSRGPIVRNGIFDGEVYDARLEKDGWDTPAYDFERYNHTAAGWIMASFVEGPGGALHSHTAEPIKVMDEREPESATTIDERTVVYDIGQNLAGWAKLQVTGETGAVVSMRYAESLYPDGTIDQDNLRLAEAKDVYILRGGAAETYTPRFTYHGFRYVQVCVESGAARVEAVSVQIVRSAVEAIGTFACGNELINRIHRNVWWTEASNLHSIPTDCPQRDERMGWLNDATARAEEAFYNFDMSRFYAKWLNDIADTQDAETGAIADTAPYRWGFRPADPLVSCYLTIPLMLYRHYGNLDALSRHYDGLKAWTDSLEREAEDGIVARSYYGDWASPVGDCAADGEADGAISRATPGALVSTAHLYLNAKLMAEIAALLGKPEDGRRYAALADEVRAAFHRQFFDAASGCYASGSQGAHAIALRFGLVPPEHIGVVLDGLVRDIESRDGHLSTGNQCTKHMLETLAEHGEIETAYRIVTQTTYPSWGHMIENGATTIWERWEVDISNKMNSRNHPMHAHVGSWFYKILAGINLAEDARGADRFVIKPYPVQTLPYAEAALKTVKGELAVKWTQTAGRFALEVDVPANSRALISLPVAGSSVEVQLTESGAAIWAQGRFVEGAAHGVTGCAFRDGRLEVEIGSGRYAFEASAV